MSNEHTTLLHLQATVFNQSSKLFAHGQRVLHTTSPSFFIVKREEVASRGDTPQFDRQTEAKPMHTNVLGAMIRSTALKLPARWGRTYSSWLVKLFKVIEVAPLLTVSDLDPGKMITWLRILYNV